MMEGKDMTTQTAPDQAMTEAFHGKVLSDTSGLTTTIMASIGDRFHAASSHMPVLVQESGPMFFGGIHQWVTALARQIEPIIQAINA
jgi:hypothetical protein